MTSLPPIDRDTALRLLEKQVEEAGPDYVYQTPDSSQVCKYVVNGQPSCLIGRALVDYGVPVSVIAAWDAPTKTIGMAYSAYAADFLTYESAAVFEAAQDKQDSNESWGSALAAARIMALELAEES
jgi:hypothetical protein